MSDDVQRKIDAYTTVGQLSADEFKRLVDGQRLPLRAFYQEFGDDISPATTSDGYPLNADFVKFFGPVDTYAHGDGTYTHRVAVFPAAPKRERFPVDTTYPRLGDYRQTSYLTDDDTTYPTVQATYPTETIQEYLDRTCPTPDDISQSNARSDMLSAMMFSPDDISPDPNVVTWGLIGRTFVDVLKTTGQLIVAALTGRK